MKNYLRLGLTVAAVAVAATLQAVEVKKTEVVSAPVQPVPAAAAAPAAPGVSALTAIPPIAIADEVLVEVNGEKLTRQELEMQIAQIRANMEANRIPEKYIEKQLDMLRMRAVDEFVARNLLSHEAEKKNFTVAPADLDEAIGMVEKRCQRMGKTLDEVMKEQGVDTNELRKGLTAEIRIKKVIEAAIGTNFTPTEAELKEAYTANKDKFHMPESVRASHILLEVKPDAKATEKAEKKAKLEGIRKELLNGAEFAALAKKHSDCPSGAKAGGDLGMFTRGQMVAEFENAAFTQPLNEIGPVVETKFGYHIIKTVERNAEKTMAFEEAADSLKVDVQRMKERTAFQKYLETLKAGAKISYPAGEPAFMQERPMMEKGNGAMQNPRVRSVPVPPPPAAKDAQPKP